jgi:polar amino acid transport system permease protein
MESGRILEAGPPARIFTQAEHPRTREFLAKVL